jgi:hypothetical protein
MRSFWKVVVLSGVAILLIVRASCFSATSGQEEKAAEQEPESLKIREAADQGNAFARAKLGVMYDEV